MTRVKNPLQISPLYMTEMEHLRTMTRLIKQEMKMD